MQLCNGICIGGFYTQGKDVVFTYGVGNPQFGFSGGRMVRLPKDKGIELLNVLRAKR